MPVPAPAHPPVTGLQTADLAEELNWPAGHGEHREEPAWAADPAGQTDGQGPVDSACCPAQPALVGEQEAVPPVEKDPGAHLAGQPVLAPGRGAKQPVPTRLAETHT